MQWYFHVLKKYAVFGGRARRKEWWMFSLIHLVILFTLKGIDILIGTNDVDSRLGLVSGLYVLATLIPSRDEALVTFLQEIVMISPSEVAAMKARPSWSGLLASVDSSIRQDRELVRYRFDPKRMSALHVPTLLLTGSETASPQLKLAISGLLNSLPNRSLFVFEGQEHNAMDTVPRQFAEVWGTSW